MNNSHLDVDSMKIMITGGAGFIGSNLSKRLQSEGHEIDILDIEPRKVQNHVSLSTNKYYQVDIRDRDELEKALRSSKPDGIVHLAAVSRVIWGEQNPDVCWGVNVNGTLNLLGAIEHIGAQPWIVLASSREVYGEMNGMPVVESTEKKPKNVYGRSKLVGEEALLERSKRLGLCSTILRFSNVYGDVNDIPDRVIPRFIMAGLKGRSVEINGGSQMFDFTHIDDTIEGILAAIQKLNSSSIKGESFIDDFHLLTGTGTTLQEIVSFIEDSIDKNIIVRYSSSRDYDVDRFVGNPDKAQRELGFKARTLPSIGIPSTVEKYRRLSG